MFRPVVTVAVVALLFPAAAHGQAQRSNFETLAKATCSPTPSCAIPQRGTITCPGGDEPSPLLMPPWCSAGSQTHVRNRVLVYTILSTTDRRVSGTITFNLNMNLDTDSFSGPIWGTYRLEVPDRGSWEGTWEGLAHSGAHWTYRVVLHGAGEFEGLQVRADGEWRAGQGDRLTGVILDPGR
jgi:hypothetical protein